jgi:RNA polymerase sigma-70 factor (ECF subfamily)
MATQIIVTEKSQRPQQKFVAVRGHEDAEVAELVREFRPQIFRFLLASLRDRDVAETLTQECFLRAWRNWSSFRGEASPRTWLMQIAVNLLRDNWRSRRVQFWRHARTASVDLDEACEWLPSQESSPEQRASAVQQVRLVWAAVEDLSERQRTVFLLRFVEEMELREIAAATGLNEGTVKSHLSRALAGVRAKMGGKR